VASQRMLRGPPGGPLTVKMIPVQREILVDECLFITIGQPLNFQDTY
jgi:hypothetical protein